MADADAQLKSSDQALDALGAKDDRIQLLRTIKGVGPRVAEFATLRGERLQLHSKGCRRGSVHIEVRTGRSEYGHVSSAG